MAKENPSHTATRQARKERNEIMELDAEYHEFAARTLKSQLEARKLREELEKFKD